MDSPPSPGRLRGFTLIELLTVIAIIGVLTGILIPVTAKVRWKARSTQCMSNVRQLVQSFLLYANDHRELLPAYEKSGQADENHAFRVIYNDGYVTDPRSFVCPIIEASGQAGLGGNFLGNKYPCYYSSNQTIAPKWGPKAGKTYARPTKISQEDAARLPIVWDQRANTITTVNAHRPSDSQYGGVFGYLDGHVAFLQAPQDIIRLP